MLLKANQTSPITINRDFKMRRFVGNRPARA
jgi:hypothetical protein